MRHSFEDMTLLTESEATRDGHVLSPDRNLAMELVRATEAAAIGSSGWVGRGRKEDADGAAVDAMRAFLGTVAFDGTVVIGEGEKDHAPMLFNGERVGTGDGPACDIAVDPIDGTSLTATGRPGALSVIAVSDRGSMYDPSAVFYMDKLAAGPEARGVVDLGQSVGDNLHELARALKKPVSDIRVAVLDRPRHEGLIDEIRTAGAGTRLLSDGDIYGGINAAYRGSSIDLCLGIGGTPEGIITACAIKALGGVLQGRLAPRDAAEAKKATDAGHDLTRILGLDDLVAGDNTYFVATGVTGGDLLRGVERTPYVIRTESIVLRSASGTIRRISAEHLPEKW
ncbi:class II fructose-bisphosphatase [Gryllotalpicola koreensis]|uniref:Fructose-1,6-bisphosphatase n=2 Tax=Gryllotalpicola koreensis TaxID=993086 RepID=A0ABP8A127_9MICO